jgi:hypothetical protein
MSAAGMVPFLWGPMAWRQAHGMAYVFDTRVDDDVSEQTAELFVLFLIGLAWILPCSTCRESYTDYLLGYLKRDLIEQYFAPRKVQRFVFDLHNMVNKKLDRPLATDFDLVLRRSEIWSVEFLPRELFGFLFIVALNFEGNSEPNKNEHYREFFGVLPALLLALGHVRMSVALKNHLPIQNKSWTQTMLVKKLYSAFQEWHPSDVESPSLESIVSTYSLCRNK